MTTYHRIRYNFCIDIDIDFDSLIIWYEIYIGLYRFELIAGRPIRFITGVTHRDRLAGRFGGTSYYLAFLCLTISITISK